MPGPRRRGPDRPERRRRPGRAVGDLAPQAEVAVARRQALHGGRRRLQLGVRGRSGHDRGHQRATTRTSSTSRSSTPTPSWSSSRQPTPAWFRTFGGTAGVSFRSTSSSRSRARRRGRPREPQARRDRALPDRRLPPGDIDPGRAEPELSRAEPAVLRSGSSSRAAATPSRPRAQCIQTGEYDFAWNIQVEDDVLRRMEQGGKGRDLTSHRPRGIEHILVQRARPLEARSTASARARSPRIPSSATRPCARPSPSRRPGAIHEQLYGRLGQATRQLPQRAAPLPLAEHALGVQHRQGRRRCSRQAGWKRGADGVRAKDGKRLKILYQTSINPVRQKTQAIVKQAAARAGIEVELKSVIASVYFGSPTSPTRTRSSQVLRRHPDVRHQHDAPGATDGSWIRSCRGRSPTKANSWSGRNNTRWRNEEYDRAWRAAGRRWTR